MNHLNYIIKYVPTSMRWSSYRQRSDVVCLRSLSQVVWEPLRERCWRGRMISRLKRRTPTTIMDGRRHEQSRRWAWSNRLYSTFLQICFLKMISTINVIAKIMKIMRNYENYIEIMRNHENYENYEKLWKLWEIMKIIWKSWEIMRIMKIMRNHEKSWELWKLYRNYEKLYRNYENYIEIMRNYWKNGNYRENIEIIEESKSRGLRSQYNDDDDTMIEDDENQIDVSFSNHLNHRNFSTHSHSKHTWRTPRWNFHCKIWWNSLRNIPCVW